MRQPNATPRWTATWAALPAWVRLAVWAFLAAWLLEIVFLAGYRTGRRVTAERPSENGESSPNSPFADSPPSDLAPTDP